MKGESDPDVVNVLHDLLRFLVPGLALSNYKLKYFLGASTIDAGLTLTGPIINWSIHNNRGKLGFGVAPTALASSPENWFRMPVIRQHLDDYDETNGVDPIDMVTWARNNLSRIEKMFSSPNAEKSCQELTALENALADKYFGPSNT